MKGELCHELEVAVPAAKVWAVYGTIYLAKNVHKLLPDMIEKVDIEGDGEEGTTIKAFSVPGYPGPRYFKETIVKVDDEKRVKEVKQIEGGFLDHGFLSLLWRFQILDKGSDACVIKTTVVYEAGADANTSLTTDVAAAVAQAVAKDVSG